ncbi:MAG: MFS transporter [Actinomycetales bacterium]|nr:MFS transporter [Actinomycetales bacterium]
MSAAPPADDSHWARRVAPLAVVAASGAAVVYLPQPIQTLVADEFDGGVAAAAIPPVVVLVGYAFGLVVFVSIGDRLSPRAQVSAQLVATACAVGAAALAPAFGGYVVACLVAGAAASYGQIIIATALRSVAPDARARVVAVILGAFMIGMFAMRTGLGALAGVLGWRAVLLGIAIVILALVIPALLALPHDQRTSPPGVLRVIRSLPAVALRSPALVLMTAVHAAAFASFITAWAVSTIVAVEEIGLDVSSAALLGLAGVAAGGIAIGVARAHRRVGAPRSIAIALSALVAGALLFAVAGTWLPTLAIALFLLSLGLITSQVTTQAEALASVGPAEAGRANTVYTSITFLLGAGMTWLGGALVHEVGFWAVGVLIAALGLLALALTLVARRRGVIA